jgi:hypothetical protein
MELLSLGSLDDAHVVLFEEEIASPPRHSYCDAENATTMIANRR